MPKEIADSIDFSGDLMAGGQSTLHFFWATVLSSDGKRLGASRLNLTVPALVFATLLTAGTITDALCGAVESRSKLQSNVSDDNRLIHNENIVGYSPNDPLATCGRERSKMGERCRKHSTAQEAGH